MNTLRNPRRHQAGAALVELSIVLVIMGVAAVALWYVVAENERQRADVVAVERVKRAEAALYAFLHLHHHLPCPAKDSLSGDSVCDGAASGKLPFGELGTDSSLGELDYAIGDVAVLTAPAGRFMALVPAPAGVGIGTQQVSLQSLTSGTQSAHLDLCAAAAQAGAQDAFTLTDRSGAAGGSPQVRGHVAVTRAQLLSQLNCPGGIATAGSAHFYAHLAAATVSTSMVDLLDQVNLWYANNLIDLLSGPRAVIKGASDLFKLIAVKPHLAEATLVESEGTNVRPFIPLPNAMALAILNEATALANFARFDANWVFFEEMRREADRLKSASQALRAHVWRRALQSSSSAYFLEAQ